MFLLVASILMFVTIYIVMNIKILATNKNILCPKHSVTINIERHISLTFHTATAENQWEISPCLVSQNMVSFSEPSESNTKLEIYKAFQDHLAFLNQHDSLAWLGSLDKSNLLKIPDCQLFRVLKTLTGSRPEKVSKEKQQGGDRPHVFTGVSPLVTFYILLNFFLINI